MKQLSIARALIVGPYQLPMTYVGTFPSFLCPFNENMDVACFPQEVLTCAECPCVRHFGLGFLVANNHDKVFLSTLESVDDMLSACQVLVLHQRVVKRSGDGDLKCVGTVWLGAGPAQPGTGLSDISDLDVVALCCKARSGETLSKDLKRKDLREQVSQCCEISFPVHSK